jgi:hypothetical protein
MCTTKNGWSLPIVKPACDLVCQPRSATPQTRTCAHDGGMQAIMIRAWEALLRFQAIGRPAEAAVLKFRGRHVCARSHRNKKNPPYVILRSVVTTSSYQCLFGYWFWSHACRPRARVIRACAVGTARRGARIERLLRKEQPAKPAVPGSASITKSLPHGCQMSPRAPQLRAIGGSVGRTEWQGTTLPLSPASRNGTGHLPFANRAGYKHS